MIKRFAGMTCIAALALFTAAAQADVFQTYEDVSENFYGLTWDYSGVQFHDVNNVSGVFPDGSTFDVPEAYERNVIVENATLLYNDFPTFGSPVNALTFGPTYIPGDNLSIGPLASVWMDLDELSQAASFELAYFENGPWGGIEYRLDALLSGQVVTSDSFLISDLGGRDNLAFTSMSVNGPQFDQLHFYAMFGGEYSMPRAFVDNLSVTAVPEPTSFVLLASLGLLGLRRR